MKNNAVNAGTVDWDTISGKALSMAEGINNPYELGPVMEYLYKSIDDFHGAFFYNDKTMPRTFL